MIHDSCPLCGTDLIGDPIPQESRDRGSYGEATHFRREIGVEIRGVYDGVLYWKCPDCGGAWNRWPKKTGDRLYEAAQLCVDRVNSVFGPRP